MDTKRGKYTEEFKSAAVDRLYEPGAVLSKVAKELGLTSTQLKIWRLEREAAGSQEASAFFAARVGKPLLSAGNRVL